MSDFIHHDINERVWTVTIDRPPLNILNLEAILELRRSLESHPARENAQVLVVRGAGDKAFSAGVAVEDHTPDRVDTMLEEFHRLLKVLTDFPMPTVAGVEGHCLGGGMELAMACDMVVARRDSRFGQPEIHLGCFPPFAAAYYPRILGHSRTFDLLLTGRTIDCAEAERMGLVARCEDPDRFEQTLHDLIDSITAHSRVVTWLTTRAIRRARSSHYAEALDEIEQIYLRELARTEDMKEGLSAFLEKRNPDWKHR